MWLCCTWTVLSVCHLYLPIVCMYKGFGLDTITVVSMVASDDSHVTTLLYMYIAGWTLCFGWEYERRSCAMKTCMQCQTTANLNYCNKSLESETLFEFCISMHLNFYPPYFSSHLHLYPPPSSLLLLCLSCNLLTHALMCCACLHVSTTCGRKVLAAATWQTLHRRTAAVMGCYCESFVVEDAGTCTVNKCGGT